MTPKTILNASCVMVLAVFLIGFACLSGTVTASACVALASIALVGITMNINSSASGGGLTNQSGYNRTGSAAIGYEETLTAGTAGTLSTRATDVAGTITVATGHAIVTGDIIDVHWDIGGVKGVAYKCTAGTVAAAPSDTSIPFTLASGDVLPAVDSSVVVSEVYSVNTNIDGDNLGALSIMVSTNDTSLRTAVHIQFQDSGAAEIAEEDFVTNVPRLWDITGGDTNPFTGNPITASKVTNGGSSSTETYTLKIIGVQDASP